MAPHLNKLLQAAEGLEPMRTAVVHLVHGLMLRATRTKEAADAGFIVPVLVGPKAKI
ncbi:MAG: hypothetical protein ACREV3_01895 [Gammaproteobacteria bacterium]